MFLLFLLNARSTSLSLLSNIVATCWSLSNHCRDLDSCTVPVQNRAEGERGSHVSKCKNVRSREIAPGTLHNEQDCCNWKHPAKSTSGDLCYCWRIVSQANVMETNDHGRHTQKVGLVGLVGLVFMLSRTNLWNTFLTALACIGPTWGVPTQVFAAAKGSPNAARKSRMASASWIKPNLNEFYPSGFVISLAMKELKGQQKNLNFWDSPSHLYTCHAIIYSPTRQCVK